VLLYEDRTQNYDPEIHEEYLMRDTAFLLPLYVFVFYTCTCGPSNNFII